MRKVTTIGIAALILGGIGLAGLFSYAKLKTITRRTSATQPTVAASLAMNEREAAVKISQRFGQTGRAAGDKFARLQFYAAGDTVFPDEAQLQIAAETDRFLQPYAQLAPALRRNDFYLMNAGDDYWLSEYDCNGQPAEFRCHFIIHLEPQTDLETRIEIFEYQPQIRVGKRFAIGGHKLIGFYDDIRNVEATTLDRLELLTAIEQALNR